MDETAALGARVAKRRRQLHLSQAELAQRLGRSESWLSQVERGVRVLDRLSVLTKLAEALSLPLADLTTAPIEPRGVRALQLDLQDATAALAVIAAIAEEVGTDDAEWAITRIRRVAQSWRRWDDVYDEY